MVLVYENDPVFRATRGEKRTVLPEVAKCVSASKGKPDVQDRTRAAWQYGGHGCRKFVTYL